MCGAMRVVVLEAMVVLAVHMLWFARLIAAMPLSWETSHANWAGVGLKFAAIPAVARLALGEPSVQVAC